MKKKQISEEQQLNEFVGKIASAMFTKKANKIVKATQNNPKIHRALSQYKKDLEDFRARMKKLGVICSWLSNAWPRLIRLHQRSPRRVPIRILAPQQLKRPNFDLSP